MLTKIIGMAMRASNQQFHKGPLVLYKDRIILKIIWTHAGASQIIQVMLFRLTLRLFFSKHYRM